MMGTMTPDSPHRGRPEAMKPITVAWSLERPPVAAKRWHVWTEDDAERVAGKGGEGIGADRRVEAQLGWPPGTVAALRAAFEVPLSRSIGWNVAARAGEAFVEAARWFRRGVACRSGVESAAPGPASATRESGRYSVRFSDAPSLAKAADRDAVLGDLSRWLVVDGNVAKAWPEVTKATPKSFVVTADESRKTLEAVGMILDAWRAAGKPPAWTIVTGGLLADVAAFAAALCGATFRFVPTTLLAMADACVGGKTGVNFPPFGKNQVGAFAFPDDVLVWPGWLASLPPRERDAGGAECLKHALLANDLPWASRLAAALASGDVGQLGAELPGVVAFKAEVVARDPGEAGERAILNLGHTLGHAIEGLSQKTTSGETTILHGEAVAYGMVFAILLSQRVSGLSAEAARARIDVVKSGLARGSSLTAAALTRSLGGLPLRDRSTWRALAAFLEQDKKAEAGSARWVLLGRDGAPVHEKGDYTPAVADADVEACWADFVRAL
jgi:3-dehydroquinate synthetase